ncbi:hypothetical protein SCHPADRAFT_896791 [Schizopora paradoxa]|uniref:F-box domain-containing protein n=1 Tax=Schizopora paradoxa TaxID=27342 RepID=A0A0H2RIU1_9AGAM|nr:hypothetical protein SCHPADRAFT_896791 [Schizopora paradoxa]
MSENAANICFNVPDIILWIAHFVDSSDSSTLSVISRTTRCAYVTLVDELSREISCHIVDVPSLAEFLSERTRRAGKLDCRSTEIIGKECFYSDPRELESNQALAKILRLVSEYQTLQTFYHHAWDETDTFLCLPKEIFHALGHSSNSITTMNITAHPCNWDTLFTIEFKVMRKFQLALSPGDTRTECGRTEAGTPIHRSNVSNFLQNMGQLTHLVLTISSNLVGDLDITKLRFPNLESFDLSRDFASPGLYCFVARHMALQYLHLHFKTGHIPSPFRDYHLPELRALKMNGRNTNTLATFLGKKDEVATITCARRPRLEHLRIHDVDRLYYLNVYVLPLASQLRRLDLHFFFRSPPFEIEFGSFLASFEVLVELSISFEPRLVVTLVEDPHSQTFSALTLRTILRYMDNCSSLKALHLCDTETYPLLIEDLQNLSPVPKSIEFISWRCYNEKQVFRVVHDQATMSAHAVPFNLPLNTKEVVHDWRNENTIQTYFSS